MLCLLDRLRRYITTSGFDLTKHVMKALQDDFVTMRQTEQCISVEAFHSFLVLGRLSEKLVSLVLVREFRLFIECFQSQSRREEHTHSY